MSGANAKTQFITGRILERIRDSEIIGRFGKADVITDLWGILAYSADPGLTFERYLRLLKPGGRIYTMELKRRVLVNGQNLSFVDWLRTIPGIEAETLPLPYYSAENPLALAQGAVSIRIRKTADNVKFPRLEQTGAERGSPEPGWIARWPKRRSKHSGTQP